MTWKCQTCNRGGRTHLIAGTSQLTRYRVLLPSATTITSLTAPLAGQHLRVTSPCQPPDPQALWTTWRLGCQGWPVWGM